MKFHIIPLCVVVLLFVTTIAATYTPEPVTMANLTSNVWILDDSLGVFTFEALNNSHVKVESKFWQDYPFTQWHTAIGSLDTDAGVLYLLDDVVTAWGGGTHLRFRDSGMGWHRFGSDYMCHQPTISLKQQQQQQYDKKQKKSEHHGVDTVREDITKVHVIFMTHFDLGYTDFAWCTVSHYFWQIYPGVVQTAAADPTYIFTTHPWLLYAYFNCDRLLPHIRNLPGVAFVCPTEKMKSDLGATIRAGQLVWHAFAFDGFNEMLGKDMFEMGFDYSAWLSATFGVAAVNTMSQVDVPGLYRVQLGYLNSNNVSSLYIGQNPFYGWAGAVVALPNLFLWKTLDGSAPILTMTHQLGYGGITPSDAIINPDTKEALVVQCVLENSPPYTPVDVINYKNRVRRYFPNAQVVASTFDNFAKSVLRNSSAIPVVSEDIGDSWVRASASDPVKTAAFLEHRRSVEQCMAAGECKRRSDDLMDEVFFAMTGVEHNWGLPLQGNDWESPAASYEEKRGFFVSARSVRKDVVVEKKNKTTVFPLLQQFIAVPMGKRFVPGDVVTCGSYEIAFDKIGAISHLRNTKGEGVTYANATHTLGGLVYEIHATNGRYNNVSSGWGDPVDLLYHRVPQFFDGTYTTDEADDGCVFSLPMTLEQNASHSLVVDGEVRLSPSSPTSQLNISFDISGKKLSYEMYGTWTTGMPQGDALSVRFNPTNISTWGVVALSREYSPFNFAYAGVSHFHVADEAKAYGQDQATTKTKMGIHALDTPLLIFGQHTDAGWASDKAWARPPNTTQGILYNIFNQWNANWVVGWPWKHEIVKARYEVKLNN
eukprot:PhM_4_TR8768/c0_g1_i1/m.37002